MVIQRQKTYIKIISFFLLLVLAVIFLILHFALARATIKVVSNQQDTSDNVLVEMQDQGSQNISPESILGKIITVEFDMTATSTASQSTTESTKSAGYVTIYNNYSENQTLVATTRLLTPDQKLYRLKDRVVIPAGQTKEVWVEADQEGDQFVIGPTTFTIPGLWPDLQTLIYAETKTGLTKQSQPTYTATQEDLEALKTKFQSLAKNQALTLINAQLSDNLKISDKRLFMNYETTASTLVGSQTKEITLTQKVIARGLVFDEADLVSAAQNKYLKTLDSDQKLIEFDAQNLTYDIVEINSEDNQAILSINILATVASAGQAFDIDKDQLTGKTAQQVREYLEGLNIQEAEIKLSPFWVKKVPKIKDHIIIE